MILYAENSDHNGHKEKVFSVFLYISVAGLVTIQTNVSEKYYYDYHIIVTIELAKDMDIENMSIVYTHRYLYRYTH